MKLRSPLEPADHRVAAGLGSGAVPGCGGDGGVARDHVGLRSRSKPANGGAASRGPL